MNQYNLVCMANSNTSDLERFKQWHNQDWPRLGWGKKEANENHRSLQSDS